MRSHISCATSSVCVLIRIATPALAHPLEYALDQLRAAGIETDHRFIHEHRLRVMKKRSAHDQTLFHAVGEALHQLVLPATQLEEFEHLAHALRRAVAVHSVETGVKLQELARRQLFIDVRAVGDEPERRLWRSPGPSQGRGH